MKSDVTSFITNNVKCWRGKDVCQNIVTGLGRFKDQTNESVAGAAVATPTSLPESVQAAQLTIRLLPAAPATHQLTLQKPAETSTPGRNILSFSAVILRAYREKLRTLIRRFIFVVCLHLPNSPCFLLIPPWTLQLPPSSWVSRVPPWISRVPPRLLFPRSQEPPRFPQPTRFPVREILPGSPPATSSRSPSSQLNPPDHHHSTSTPRTPCWWSVESLPGILLLLFFFLPSLDLVIIFPPIKSLRAS